MEKETIKIRKLDCDLKKNIKLNGDFLVPDTKPDVISIIGVNGLCFMKKIEAQNGKLRVEGNYNGTVIYLSDLGETKCLNINFDFSENIENNKITSSDEFNWRYIVLNKEARIINERKINLEISLDLLLTDYKIEDIEMIINFDDSSIQKLQKQIIVKEFLNTNVVNNSISEELEITEDGKDFDILKKEISIDNIGKKISYNKILVKADANMELIYTVENQIKKYSRKIPIMSFIEMPNIKEENIIDLDYDLKMLSINTDNNSYNCDLEYEITCNVFNEKAINVIEDLYSLTKDVEYVKNSVFMECITEKIDEQLSFSEKIEISNLKEIYDYNYCLKKISKVSDDKFEGNVFVELFYSKEDNNGVFQKSFEFKFDTEENNFEIESCNIKSIGGDYYIDYTIRIINRIKYQDISVIKDLEIIETENKNDYSMIIYYVKPDDTIWTISKEFKVKPDNLTLLNRIENPENIMVGEKLYIMRG